MLRLTALTTLLLFSVLSGRAQSGDSRHLSTCLDAAARLYQLKQPGDFNKLEYLDPSEDGVPTYEIEVVDKQGREWECMCDATTGRIYEIEQEVGSASDKRFAARAKVDEKTARQTALDVYGGEVLEVEYEIERNGDPTYEFDVMSGETEWKIEVDAVTGRIIEVHVEQWEIGTEPDERR